MLRSTDPLLEPPDDPMRILKPRLRQLLVDFLRQLEPPDDPMRILKRSVVIPSPRRLPMLEPPDDPMRILKRLLSPLPPTALVLEPPDDPMRILKLKSARRRTLICTTCITPRSDEDTETLCSCSPDHILPACITPRSDEDTETLTIPHRPANREYLHHPPIR